MDSRNIEAGTVSFLFRTISTSFRISDSSSSFNILSLLDVPVLKACFSSRRIVCPSSLGKYADILNNKFCKYIYVENIIKISTFLSKLKMGFMSMSCTFYLIIKVLSDYNKN